MPHAPWLSNTHVLDRAPHATPSVQYLTQTVFGRPGALSGAFIQFQTHLFFGVFGAHQGSGLPGQGRGKSKGSQQYDKKSHWRQKGETWRKSGTGAVAMQQRSEGLELCRHSPV